MVVPGPRRQVQHKYQFWRCLGLHTGCSSWLVPHGFLVSYDGVIKAGRSLTEKKSVPEPVFPKKPAGTPCAQPWLVAVGGWRLAAVDGGQLATGSWWQLVVVGGSWWLVIGGWWLVVVGSGWQLAVGGCWRLAAVGGWRLVAVGGGWRLMGVGGWRLVVPWGGP